MDTIWKIDQVIDQLIQGADKAVFDLGVRNINKMDFSQIRSWYKRAIDMFNDREKKMDYFKREIVWSMGKDSATPYLAHVENAVWEIRVNDYPDKDIYSLLIDGNETQDFNKWPECWHKPEKTSNLKSKL